MYLCCYFKDRQRWNSCRFGFSCRSFKEDGESGKGRELYLSFRADQYSGNVVRVTYYAQVVAQKFVQHELMKFGNLTIQAARDERLDVANAIAQTAANLDRINEVMTANSRITHIDRILEKSLSEALEREQSLKEGRAFGIPTGLTEMDRLLSGFMGVT